MYNDNSVLENRHVSLLYTLLANEPHADIFTDLEDAKWKDMRKLIINCIIHTDMVHHFPMVSKVTYWATCMQSMHTTVLSFSLMSLVSVLRA